MLDAHPAAGVAAAVVWIPMLAGDDAAAACEASALVADPRARHFYDAERRGGRAVARSIGAAGQVAWDMYLFYGPGARWTGNAPAAPAEWLHQLGGRAWADQTRWRWGDDLTAGLLAIAGRLLAQ